MRKLQTLSWTNGTACVRGGGYSWPTFGRPARAAALASVAVLLRAGAVTLLQRFCSVVAVGALVWLAGCESVSQAGNAVRGGRLAARDEGRTRTFAATPRATYDALKTAAAGMGYRFVRGGPAQGEFEAMSGVAPGETHGSARQIALKSTLRASLDGQGTVVNVRLTEIIEADSSNRAGQATETPLRDTPQYEVLFTRVARGLGLDPAAK